jgi:serine/threonine-protein kinase
VLLYECVSGRQPFEGDDLRILIAAILHEEPMPLSAFVQRVPDELSKIVARALQKRPQDRFSDAREMADALRDFVA